MSIQRIKSGVIADGQVTNDKMTLAADASAIKTALNASGDPGIYACRAWVNFNGTANSNLTGTYSQSGTTMTVTVTSHGLTAGQSVLITFQTGAAGAETFTVVSVTNANVFVVTSVTSRTTSGNCTLNFNTIRGSGNVSSITDNGTGDYTVNFTSAMPDANYSVVVSADPATGSGGIPYCGLSYSGFSPTGSIARVRTTTSGSFADSATVCVSIFR
jgi:hypothetical protein